MRTNGTLTDTILTTLKERSLLAKRDVIESALEDPGMGQKNQEWVLKHLQPDTLLSREELTLYNKLESSGALQPLLRDTELSATRPFLEDDIRSAIESLEASTVTIQRQTETLSLQCETLKRQMRQQDSWEQDRSRDIARLRKKHEGGRQSTNFAANDLADELEACFRSATDKAGAENKQILASLSTRLKQDDKILAGLETLISDIKSNSNDAATVKRTSQLGAMLADYNAEEIHYRLDRLYLETILSGPSTSCQNVTEGETITALEEELESLYPEIEILAEMSTKQQFHEPILREIHHQHSQLRAASEEKLAHALDVLVDMTQSKKALTKQLGERESSCELLEQLASLYQAEAGSQSMSQSSSRRESLRRRSMPPGMLLGVAPRGPAPVPQQRALESLLRRIGVSPESVIRPQVADGGARELHEKRIHLSEMLRGLGAAVDSPLVTQLAPSDSALQLLASALHANSHFETSLRDPSQETALSGLESELASLQRGVQGLNLDVLHQRDKTQDRFLERWG
ncbi:uncharacterized protein N7482_010257 [Penicillium canariense]|uniref:Uncharacterized protein n=1 Tax=Penicillium canariense TaxID=189055 RepID=A0A9W9HLG4_9EURO|nr:uncharacterized protein N7482_010257 [Penicillium canariense]KAJ5151005.1 hypothetical protein N7482_010257 [Penicillium canariense]